MSMRHTMKVRRILTAAAITSGLVLALAGCGGGDDGKNAGGKPASSSTTSKKPDEKPQEPTTQTPASDAVLAQIKGGEGETLVVNSAVRDAGGFVTVSGKVTNGRQGRWLPTSWSGDEKELNANAASMAGASLVDRAGKKKYLILRDTDGRCLCTKFSGGFKAGEEKSFFAQFPAPPAGTTKVDFQIADMPPASIEISEGQ